MDRSAKIERATVAQKLVWLLLGEKLLELNRLE
jgi:hypothetical protein